MSSSRQARQADQVAREIDDLHRLAHVEHEDLAAAAHQPGLQHELRGLGDGHEVARDLGMRHRDRPAGRDLLAELRDHAAGRAEHVAEAHGHEARRPRSDSAWHTSSARRLVAPMTLVGFTALSVEMSTNFLDAVPDRGLGDAPGAEHVVVHRLPGVVVLHQRHVLVGGGVEDRRRPVLLRAPRRRARVLHVADHVRELRASGACCRTPARCCRARTRSSRAARGAPARSAAIWRQSSEPIEPPAPVTSTTRPCSHAVQAGAVERHRIAAEQVVELDAAQLRDGDLAAHQIVVATARSSPRARLARRARARGGGPLCDALGIAMIACSTSRCGRDRGQVRRACRGPARRGSRAGASPGRRRAGRRRATPALRPRFFSRFAAAAPAPSTSTGSAVVARAAARGAPPSRRGRRSGCRPSSPRAAADRAGAPSAGTARDAEQQDHQRRSPSRRVPAASTMRRRSGRLA